MQHRKPADKDRAILWARKIINRKDEYVILDTETTGLKKNDVVVQIAIIDLNGNELLNSLVRPTKRKRISAEATAIHGIKMLDLKDAPTFAELLPKIKKNISPKRVIIYNAEYDEKIIEQTCEQDECNYLRIHTECAMINYSKFVGVWSDYHCDYSYQKLPCGDHTAIGDCRATLKLIHDMSQEKYSNPAMEKISFKNKGCLGSLVLLLTVVSLLTGLFIIII